MAAMTFILFCCHLSSQTDSLFISWGLIKAAEPREAASHWVSTCGLWKTETWYSLETVCRWSRCTSCLLSYLKSRKKGIKGDGEND